MFPVIAFRFSTTGSRCEFTLAKCTFEDAGNTLILVSYDYCVSMETPCDVIENVTCARTRHYQPIDPNHPGEQIPYGPGYLKRDTAETICGSDGQTYGTRVYATQYVSAENIELQML